ncbi:type IV toxin-antitoxin system AbiEi family antitoxin domain-containing protein [Phycicoccus flavus]|uniref:type IV toxin-antitoxin system AbiEi family antitoxin domain-containing protein n=1 Tax=Phycicoccus flavus TaxID=2502783 RepID=UPI000FEB71F0|nr:type IV toxin-antitoxin system AbiEi family antitoxin domain-containing protein [Phycicoccus flavus]NHA69405.1 type IV toxin-antitoxin system AbiEi family antitoxin domain-containing protein [Phycicoccus flavus]
MLAEAAAERLRAYATARGGVFTSAHAAALGVDDPALRRLRRAGAVVRVRRDAYVLGGAWCAAGPEARLRLRTRAILLTRPGDVASHESALALHALPLLGPPLGAPLDVVDVLADVGRTRLSAGLRPHPRAGLDHVVADGYRCVPVNIGLAQVVLRSGPTAGLVPLDAALHGGLASRAGVAEAFDVLATPGAGRRRADDALRRCSALAESPGETLTRLALVDAGLEVRPQVAVHGDDGQLVGRVDLLVGERVVVEFDGAVKYAGAQGRDALVAEKHREDALRELGYVVVRVTWADLLRPELVVARVRRAMSRLSS